MSNLKTAEDWVDDLDKRDCPLCGKAVAVSSRIKTNDSHFVHANCYSCDIIYNLDVSLGFKYGYLSIVLKTKKKKIYYQIPGNTVEIYVLESKYEQEKVVTSYKNHMNIFNSKTSEELDIKLNKIINTSILLQ